MVSRKLLHKFEEKGGYNIVEKAPKGWETWGIIQELANKTDISYVSVLEIREDHPIRPSKILPIYVGKFEESGGYRLLKEDAKYGEGTRYHEIIKSVGLKAFAKIGEVDPKDWTDKHISALRRDPDFIDSITQDIDRQKASMLNAFFVAMRRYDLLAPLKDVKKRPKGIKAEWYLREEDLLKLIASINEVDTLLLLYTGIVSGARYSALGKTKTHIGLRAGDINYSEHRIRVYEPKRREFVTKEMPKTGILDLLHRYITDFGFEAKDPIFRWAYKSYEEKLKNAGVNSGIDKTLIAPVTTHILKHTFVSQASKRGVSLETISEQTGTDPATLKDYYRAVDPAKIRHELYGEPYEIRETWEDWLKEIHPKFEAQYNELLKKCVLVNGIRKLEVIKAPKVAKPRKPRKINWLAIESMIKKFEALPKEQQEKVPQRRVIPFWKKALYYHKQRLSDSEAIRKAKAS